MKNLIAALFFSGVSFSGIMVFSTNVHAYSCNSNYYTNAHGQRVHSPSCKSKNYTAICRDGSYSHSMHHRGTCSRHGGVRHWA